jgi:hypothetical protein
MFLPNLFSSRVKRAGILVLGLFLLCATAFSQTRIFGKVKDLRGHPIPGASITVKNSFDGATSDSSGDYSFSSTIPPPLTVTQDTAP